MTTYRTLHEITNWIPAEDAVQNLTLLSLVTLIEAGAAAPPSIHVSNWHTNFRDLQRHSLPNLNPNLFWEGVYMLSIHHGMAQIMGKHGVPITTPSTPPQKQFLENIRLYEPNLWRNTHALREVRWLLWERLSQHRSLTVPFATFYDHFQNEHELIFSKTQVQTAYAAFHTASNKRFLLLSGLSGTGKTQLLLQFAQSYLNAGDLNPQDHILKISVSPDWRDPSPLLGYINPMVDRSDQLRFVRGEMTDFLIRAHRYPLLPFFLILDEMNLARVELYFAPLLSAMETPQEPIVIHGERGSPSGIPGQIDRWPSNLFISGTVNMDETTHPFSDKVLDRAFTMEFWEIDIESYLQKNIPKGYHRVLSNLYYALLPAHCHFGYRVLKEIQLFLHNVERMGGGEDLQKTLLDQAVFSKILPKIRGQHTPELEKALQKVLDICSQESLNACQQKITQMLSRLQNHGMTRFWA